MEIKKFRTKLDVQPSVEANIESSSPIDPKKLPDNVISIINERISDEYTAYYFYTNAFNWCKDKNYKKASSFFGAEAMSELEHSKGLQDYLTQWNVIPTLPQVETTQNFDSLVQIINKAYSLEFNLLNKYSKDAQSLISLHQPTFNFIQGYVDKQNESVAEYSDLLNALKLVNSDNKFEILYFEQTYF